MSRHEFQGLLLSRTWRDVRDHLLLEYWLATDSGGQLVEVRGERCVFFIFADDLDRVSSRLNDADEIRPISLIGFDGRAVLAVYFRSWRRLCRAAKALADMGVDAMEADVKPSDRYLMERFIKGGMYGVGGAIDALGGRQNPTLSPSVYVPNLKCVSLDIETTMDAQHLLSIGVSSGDLSQVWMCSDTPSDSYLACSDETQLLECFLQWWAEFDADIVVGWNLVGFDLWVLQQVADRCGVEFTLGRRRRLLDWREDGDGRRYVYCAGRSVLCGIEAAKTAGFKFDSYALDAVAQQVIGDGKLLVGSERGHDIQVLYETDQAGLAEYNKKDCQLVERIFEELELLSYLEARAHLTGADLSRFGGSVVQFEYLYLPSLHRAGFVAPNLGQRQFDISSPGGFVMESQPGLFEHVLVFDFKSLYPSIIRSFGVDPAALWCWENDGELPAIQGYEGVFFARDRAVLPTLIELLWSAREQAKSLGHTANSTAIKILMNSCYGVLGSPVCRFFDPRVAASITRRGHEILQRTRARIEQDGLRVIYGDTDSVFVWLPNCIDSEVARAEGKRLELLLNRFWRETLQLEHGIESHLELEFETHYRHFFMPTIRNAQTGSKKRYAGLIEDDKAGWIQYKGLESVRSDWTELAKIVQRGVFERVFRRGDWRAYLKRVVHDLKRGHYDSMLVYRKRLRKPLDQYDRMTPPHIRAARQSARIFKKGDWIKYVMTLNGVVLADGAKAVFDYEHYIEKQIKPSVEGILLAQGERFESVIGDQLGLGF